MGARTSGPRRKSYVVTKQNVYPSCSGEVRPKKVFLGRRALERADRYVERQCLLDKKRTHGADYTVRYNVFSVEAEDD